MILLKENKQMVAVGQITENTDTDIACFPINSHLVSINVVLVHNTHGIYEDIFGEHIIKTGESLFWPIKLLGRPIRVTLQDKKNEVLSETKPEQKPLPSPVSDLPPTITEDRVFNYGLQVMQLGLFKMQLDDTEHEGDGLRMLRNWKLLMLYGRSKKRGKKYSFEAMRLLTHCKALYTEKTAHKIINGQFVNPKGGEGNNYANDLKQEHLVRCSKVLLRGLCGNKTLKAVSRSTTCAYSLKVCMENFDNQSGITQDSTSHTYGDPKSDIKEMIGILRKLKPFQHKPGRKHDSFPCIPNSQLDKLDPVLLDKWLTRSKKSLAKNSYIDWAENEDGEIDEQYDDLFINDNDEDGNVDQYSDEEI